MVEYLIRPPKRLLRGLQMGLIQLFFRGGRRVQDEEQVLYDSDYGPAEYFRDGNREIYIPTCPTTSVSAWTLKSIGRG